MTRFADAGDDHPAPRSRQDADGLREGLAHAVGQGRPDRGNAIAFKVDASVAGSVAALFDEVDERLGEPDVVVYNASARAHGPIAEIDPAAVERAVAISALGGFYVTQQAARRMLPRARGAILLTGASASVKGFPLSSAFGMGKFALRGMAQSAAREAGRKASGE